MADEQAGGGALTRQSILLATERVLRRYGVAKATVVDVARELGVSHGSVYRHFASKAALREEVTRQWLARPREELSKIANDDGMPAVERLRLWLETLHTARRAQAAEDPELFATFYNLAREQSGVVGEHVTELISQIETIIRSGVVTGGFTRVDIAATARAVHNATVRFHHPAHAHVWSREEPDIRAEFEGVCALVMRGLTT